MLDRIRVQNTVRKEAQRIQQQNFSKQARAFAFATVILFAVSLITFLVSDPLKAFGINIDDLDNFITFFGFLPFGGGWLAICLAISVRRKLKIEERKFVDRSTVAGFFVGIVSGLILFQSHIWEFF